MNSAFNIQTFATTYTTTVPSHTTTTPIDTDTTIPVLTLEDLVNKDKLNTYAKRVTKFYDNRYLRIAEVSFIEDSDIDSIVAGLDEKEDAESDDDENPDSGNNDDNP